MGCFSSKEAVEDREAAARPKREAPTKQYSKPRWKSREPLTAAKLQRMRDEFWDTQPHYGGDKAMWDAIKAACQSDDMATSRLILETAGIIVARHDMTVMYDERGVKYELPKYVLCEPSNLLQGEAAEQQQQLEMAQRQQQQQAVA
ncbi:hypothetical protein OEZ86_003173 [Tetradesmus obliquus]|uniref:DC-UbP/UBTD2 N-terminal domain-containing protein n=1 Tax=Tetradesmus obliquus TaxID=3088 RepID=A0ABY8TSU2_TETOB|nr:hypothetical protein OEZ85_012262 [Tetradesmus obliquus]WIA32335.1 hypothetical protein OEZ86_003173 [Tetradesmus obliquus]